MGGMAWDNCGVIFLFEKLKMLISSIRLQDTVGKLLLIQLSWLQFFTGSSNPLGLLQFREKMIEY